MATAVISKRRTRAIWKPTLLCVIAVYALALAGFYFAMLQPPATFGNVMKHTGPAPFLLFPFETMWKSARAGHLNTGAAAPDFALPRLDHQGTITLSSELQVRPVVLVFGSYT